MFLSRCPCKASWNNTYIQSKQQRTIRRTHCWQQWRQLYPWLITCLLSMARQNWSFERFTFRALVSANGGMLYAELIMHIIKRVSQSCRIERLRGITVSHATNCRSLHAGGRIREDHTNHRGSLTDGCILTLFNVFNGLDLCKLTLHPFKIFGWFRKPSGILFPKFTSCYQQSTLFLNQNSIVIPPKTKAFKTFFVFKVWHAWLFFTLKKTSFSHHDW